MYCPLMSFAKQYSNEQQCLGEECAFAADEGGNCLVKQALQCYVNSAKEKTEYATLQIINEMLKERQNLKYNSWGLLSIKLNEMFIYIDRDKYSKKRSSIANLEHIIVDIKI